MGYESVRYHYARKIARTNKVFWNFFSEMCNDIPRNRIYRNIWRINCGGVTQNPAPHQLHTSIWVHEPQNARNRILKHENAVSGVFFLYKRFRKHRMLEVCGFLGFRSSNMPKLRRFVMHKMLEVWMLGSSCATMLAVCRSLGSWSTSMLEFFRVFVHGAQMLDVCRL